MASDGDLTARLEALQALMDERRDTAAAAVRLLQEELDRRFTDNRRETDHRFDATIAMRVAIQEDMDRRFGDLSAQLDRRFGDSERAVQSALTSAKEAVTKAETAAEKRFEGVNEFRAQLTDQAATFMPRNEYAATHQSLIDKTDAADKRVTERVAALELRLTSRLDLGAGRDAGARDYQSERREAENLSATIRQASAASPIRANAAVIISGMAALVAVVVLILDLAGKK